ncbi:MAG: response regulator [Gemmatimonadetes bacterium]|nr:response regulator [Gemmatimonadota bacterium]
MTPNRNPLRPSRLLVIDDTASGRMTIEAALGREGHEIIQGDSGLECLRLAALHQPDLILLDVMMPGMDGFEVCRRIRQDPALRGIPIVLVTALSDNASMAQGIEAGADDFIGKPFNKWELRARVASLVRLGTQHRALAERDRFSWVFEHATDGFALLDRAGQILNCNAAARRFLGFGDGEAVQGDFMARLKPDNVPHPAGAWDHWGTPEGNDAPLFLVRNVDGAAYSEWLQVTPHRDALDPDAMTVINLKDVTAQVERQMRLFEFHELVSHKLRTPLYGVVATVDLLSADAAQFSGATAQLLDVLKVSAARLSNAVVDVLDYADRGATREAPLPISDFSALAQSVASDQHVARVSINVAPALAGASVALGETSMRTIMRELLENSRRFHPKQDPEVTVQVGSDRAGWLRIDIEDDGVTMTPGQLARALEPYVQGDPALTGEVPGMGLGLSLVATRVRIAGGRCVIENRGDRVGVRVRMELPYQAA